MRLAIDLDGTILEFDWDKWEKHGQNYWDKPKEGAIEALKRLKEDGHYIVIHTCRVVTDVNPGYTLKELVENVKKILERYDIPYDEIWTGRGKPIAHIYIDDRGYRLSDWGRAMEFIKEINKGGLEG